METELIITDTRKKMIQQKPKHKFIKGPIPYKWIQAACKLGANEGRIAWVLWFMSGVSKGIPFKLTNKRVKDFGIGRRQKYLALARLEKEGLILQEKSTGASSTITLVELSAKELSY